MSMHLVGPYMTTTNYKKRKNVKFKSAEHKRKYEEQEREWEALKAKYKITPVKKDNRKSDLKDSYKLTIPAGRDTKQYPSASSTGITSGGCTKPAPKVYTGNNLVGIATMHKSNMVPVFSNQEAEDISKMRRG